MNERIIARQTGPEKNDNQLNVVPEIMSIKQQAMSMGANDSENFEFQKILNKLENKTITPDKALEEAYNILNNKQDYH